MNLPRKSDKKEPRLTVAPRDPGPAHGADVPHRETYERIATSIAGQLPRRDSRVILVVSAVSGEGASTVARDLARSLVGSESHRVVLVDANLRSPSQHAAFGVKNAFGIGRIASGDFGLDDRSLHRLDEGLALVTAGRTRSSPVEVFDTAAFASAISELRSRFKWVVIDGPPVTRHSDAELLGNNADGVVLVLRAESTRSEVAVEAKRRLSQSGQRVLGAVLNRRRFHIPGAIYRRL